MDVKLAFYFVNNRINKNIGWLFNHKFLTKKSEYQNWGIL